MWSAWIIAAPLCCTRSGPVANMPLCLIGMGAFVGAHHLSRRLRGLGHDARLMMMSKNLSPYDLPPSGTHDRVQSQEEIQFVLCAVNARTARRRVFTNKDISVYALLASACLPHFFPAVEIDGDPHWNGESGFRATAPQGARVRLNRDKDRSRQLSGNAAHPARHLW
jgi:hypothetical protein